MDARNRITRHDGENKINWRSSIFNKFGPFSVTILCSLAGLVIFTRYYYREPALSTMFGGFEEKPVMKETTYNGIKRSISNAGDNIYDGVGDAYYKIGDTGHKIVDGTEGVFRKIGEAGGQIHDGAGNVFHKIEATGEQIYDGAGSVFYKIGDTGKYIKDEAGNLFHKIGGTLNPPLPTTGEQIKDVFEKIGEFISPKPPTMGEKIVNEVKESVGA